MKSICKVAALKVQCKQRYRLFKIRKYNCLQKRLDCDYSWVLDVTNPYIYINPSSGICKKGHGHISVARWVCCSHSCQVFCVRASHGHCTSSTMDTIYVWLCSWKLQS